MKFTADQAFEAHDAGGPIIMELAAAQRTFAEHHCEAPWETYVEEMTDQGKDPLDAAILLGWLGY